MTTALVSPPAATPASEWANRWTIEAFRPDAVILRSATAAEPEPADWRERLSGFLRFAPRIVAVGAKRLTADGRVFAMGEFVVHSKGFHHHGAGLDGRGFRFVEEVDVMASGVVAVDRAAFEAAGGAAALEGELGAVELGLRLRAAGGRCLAVPQVVVVDTHTPAPSPAEESAFAARWGFEWKAADLEAVRAAHPGSGLLWNVRFHAPGMPFEKYRDRGALVWQSYQQAEVFRQRTHHLVKVVRQLAAAAPAGAARLVDIGCGDGFFAHMFAQAGVEVIGVDREELGVAQARRQTAAQRYAAPARPPRFLVGRGDALPLQDASARVVTLLDVIEHLPNPVRVLREAARVLVPGGHFLVVTPSWQYGGSSDAIYHLTEYTMDELVRQVEAVGGLKVVSTGMIGGVYRDLVVVAQRV